MAFDLAGGTAPRPAMRIAVIGSGVSGLTAAWLLSSAHDVVVYEADRRLGGHANTIDVPTPRGPVAVDAGFIVYNEPAYPNLTALFAHLGVATEETCMSFGASMRGGAVEYSGQSLSSVFAMRRQTVSPAFWAMLADIVRFHRDARAALAGGICDRLSLADFVRARGYGESFTRDFLKPMASAIWSTPSVRVLDFSAAAFLRFYDNHGLLQVLNIPTWRTVSGGARNYVDKIAAPFRDGARLSTPVTAVLRREDGVEIVDARGGRDRFDAAVLATHADTGLALLADADEEERRLLGAFRYQRNRAILHLDPAQMPRRRRAWSSWNYLGGEDGASVTYWMNRLQNLAAAPEIFVTLNPLAPVREETIVAEIDYAHPTFDVGAAEAQRQLWRLQGRGGVWHAGAHFGQGFHEDGAQAGLAAAEALGGVRRPWRVAQESGRIHLAPALAAS